METKIIKAVFGGGTSTVTNKRTRTDYGQVLEIIGIDLPDTFECIFSNSNTSTGVGKKQIGSAQRVLIPDEYLATGQTIYAWVLVHDGEYDGRHMYSIRIPVADMPDTSPEEPTPVEQSVISQAITALNSAVTTTSQKAQEATESADRAEQAAEGAEGYAERAESAQQAAESARDIALEAKVSAQASAATASEKASEAISSATTASQSAMTAENASESAQASATASAESASQAGQSADTASGKASDASEYASNANASAQTASQKASEAAQSAQTAVQAKTDAQSAKTASETAQGLAESARDNAITAKTGAESARDEAQEIADGITGKVEQIDSNTERIESLEDDRYKPYPTDTVSGAVASFSDGADDIPLKSCIVRIEPVQAGSGDPSPDNIRPITGWTGCEVKHSGADTSNPTTYPITFPTEAGIVYGGQLNVTTGELTVDRAMVDMGTLSFAKSSGQSAVGGSVFTIPLGSVGNGMMPRERYTSNNVLSDMFMTCDENTWWVNNMPDNSIMIGNTAFSVACSEYSDAVSFRTAMNGVQICYELATPITYHLTPTEIRTLLGQNNIWADTGDTSVTYRADNELYIEKTKPVVNVDDVQINGTSIVTDGVANIPIGGQDLGTVKENLAYGIDITGQGQLLLITPSDSELKKGYSGSRRAIMTLNQHIAAFYGLAKAAGADEKDSTLPVGEYSEEAKIAIQKMLGIYEAPWELIEDFTLEEDGGFDKTVEPDGTPYNFRAAYVRITVPPNSTSIASGYGRWYFVDENNTMLTTESGRYTTNTAQMCKTILIERNVNMAIAKHNSYTTTGGRGMIGYKNISGISFDYGNIKHIYTNASDKEPAGARIEIYAQRA